MKKIQVYVDVDAYDKFKTNVRKIGYTTSGIVNMILHQWNQFFDETGISQKDTKDWTLEDLQVLLSKATGKDEK